jgi:hypothetical protein
MIITFAAPVWRHVAVPPHQEVRRFLCSRLGCRNISLVDLRVGRRVKFLLSGLHLGDVQGSVGSTSRSIGDCWRLLQVGVVAFGEAETGEIG